MNTYSNIRVMSKPFNSAPGERRLEAPAPAAYGNPAVQAHFADVSRAAGQQAAVDLSRANTAAAADYTNKANAARNQSVLGGLGLLAQQQQNAIQRDLAMQNLSTNWMKQMQSGALGGLL